MVHKLAAIVSLNRLEKKAELCASIGGEVYYVLVDIRLLFKWKGPAKMSEIIDDNQII